MSHDSDAGAAATGKGPGPLPDFCGFCGHELLGVFDRSWEMMKSIWGKVIAANYCPNGGKCEGRAHRESADVAAYITHRQQVDDQWEGDKPDTGEAA